MAKEKSVKKKSKKKDLKQIPTLKLSNEHDIALDFATKAYKKFDKIIKSVILFGSSAKKTAVAGSDIDIIIIIDDVSIRWDQELIAWYREELEKVIKANPYSKELHINTVKLSTWWQDLMRGDPIVINVLRYGEAMIDMAGFFEPQKYLLLTGKIKSTPESIYSLLERAPTHLARSKASELGAIEGLYWCMVDAAHAALIAARVVPPSPEHVSVDLKEVFVDSKKLDSKYVGWYNELHVLHKKIMQGEIRDLKGAEIDVWQARTEDFLSTMVRIVKEIVQ